MATIRVSLTLATLAGIGLAIGGGADAQSIMQMFTIPTAAVPINDNFTFNLFNTGLGTLDQVTLALSTSITAEVDVFNLNSTNQAFTNATASIPVTLTAPDAITEVATATAGPINGVATSGLNAFPGLTSNANTSQIVPMPD